MSQQIRFEADVESFDVADARAAKLEADLTKAEKQLHTQEMKVFAFAAGVLHVGNMVANIISRSAQGTEAANQAQSIAMGINIATTELSITRMSLEAFAQATTNPWASARLFATAALMQVNLIQQMELKAELERNTKQIKDIARYMEAYR
jgi:hypothetical protein